MEELLRDGRLGKITDAEAEVDDFEDAIKTAELIHGEIYKEFAFIHIADNQSDAGNSTEALNTLIVALKYVGAFKSEGKITSLLRIGKVQIKAGDVTGARQSMMNALKVAATLRIMQGFEAGVESWNEDTYKK